MLLSEINPYIRRTMRSVLPPFTRIRQRIIFDYELLYMESGEVTLTYNGRTFLCRAGEVLLICPGIPHQFDLGEQALSQPHIHFDMKYAALSEEVYISFADWKELPPAHRQFVRENLFPQLKNDPRLKISDRAEFLRRFFQVVDHDAPQSLSCKAAMLTLLEGVIEENAPENFLSPPPSFRISLLVKAYLDANYGQNFTLDDLARQFSYSKFYMEKQFRQEFGCSIMAYRNRQRMAAALSLLKQYSVAETGQRLGFSSIYAFSRCFRAYYGKSPSRMG